MIRKTNLFYTTGDESNFLTFSNYAEHMTGVYLTVDQKLFPSKFICLYSKRLDEMANTEIEESFDEAKQTLIKNYLVGYYENKLAFLRDYLLKNSILPDTKLEYLNYLLEAIGKFDNSALNNIHIGEISEQDYNGTFTDIICTIESNETQKGRINYNVNKDTYNVVEYTASTNYLYGWYNTGNVVEEDGSTTIIEESNCPTNYESVKPIFEEVKPEYRIDTNLTSISLDSTNYDIRFNIVIPLYDCIDVNYMTNDTIIVENAPIELTGNDENIVTMVPYGMWISPYTIELKRDPETKFGQAWSLLIGTQFKPFPNSSYLVTDDYKAETEKSFASFAYVLSQQNQLMDDLTKYNVLCGQLKQKISLLETQMNNIVDVKKINTLTDRVEEIWNMLSSDGTTVIKTSNKNKWLVK